MFGSTPAFTDAVAWFFEGGGNLVVSDERLYFQQKTKHLRG